MFIVYVLYGSKHNKIYIGFTSDLEQRLLSHNKLGKTGWTKSFRPWTLVFTEKFETKTEAMKREKELKTATGRRIIWEKIAAM